MGISFSCPLATYNDLETGFESLIVNSVRFGHDEVKTTVLSTSFKGQDTEPTIFQSNSSPKMMKKESLSLKSRKTESMTSFDDPSSEENHLFNTSIDSQSPRSDTFPEKAVQLPIFDLSNPKHEAAVKLQKVYKSFRTRRKLADCAVLVEQSWWKLLDFAELKHSSISFFDLDKHETAISRWSRARTRAAKVGKGLSKNGKAQKLALQHWLEAIDPRHRYGHNLHFYYVKWLHSQSKEPFFYWLDIGEGKEVNLVEKCPRSKLQQQCIKYLGPMERLPYEVIVEDGKLLYKQTMELVDTTMEPKGAKWIFVLSTSMTLYVGKKKKGAFQHSSFLAGGATSAAGRLVVEKGILKAVWPHSGHYRPTPENFQDFISFLRGSDVDLTDVKMDPTDEEENFGKQNSVSLRGNSSEEDLAEKDRLEADEIEVEDLISEKSNTTEEEQIAAALETPRNLTKLAIPNRVDLFESLESENRFKSESSLDGYETTEDQMVVEKNLSDEDDEQMKEKTIIEESILERINSHKGMNSYQLGKQLSCRWTTGAGPRIGCLRDYPSELQFRALEHVNLSPRSARSVSCPRTNFSPGVSPTTSFSGEMPVGARSPALEREKLHRQRSRISMAQSSPLCKGTTKNHDFYDDDDDDDRKFFD